MTFFCRFALPFLLAIPAMTHADAEHAVGPVQVELGKGTPESIHIKARHASLKQTLDAIAAKTGIPIHYNDLPNEYLSLDCRETSVESTLRCVLGADANLMSSHSGQAQSPSSQPEWWVLASGGNSSPADKCKSETQPESKPNQANRESYPGAVKDMTHTPHEDIPLLLEQASKEDTYARVEAMSRLGLASKEDRELARKALEKGLDDTAPEVRNEAFARLIQMGGSRGTELLQQALHDSDPTMRMLAIDNAGSDPASLALLQEALADSDPTVRVQAAARLETSE